MSHPFGSYVIQQFSNTTKQWEDVENTEFDSLQKAKLFYNTLIKGRFNFLYLRVFKIGFGIVPTKILISQRNKITKAM